MRLIIILMLLFPSIIFAQWNKNPKWANLSEGEKEKLAIDIADSIFWQIESKIKYDNVKMFLRQFGGIAVYHYNEYGISAAVNLAQGGNESAWGKSVRTVSNGKNNYFSHKCKNRIHNGECFLLDDDSETDHFMIFKNAQESWDYHTMYLLKNYKMVGRRYNESCYMLKKYATRRTYCTDILRIIHKYNLNFYDVKI